jgi:hypothetical protein
MDENWPDWSNFRHIILTWYKEPYKTKKLEKKMISQIGLTSAYSQFPSSVPPPVACPCMSTVLSRNITSLALYSVSHQYLNKFSKVFWDNQWFAWYQEFKFDFYPRAKL